MAARPSRVFQPDEVVTPGFLPDLPDVRLEISEYYSSVRRCDDMVGSVLRALRENGQDENTLVVLLSDNGMAFPYSKTNCYLQSTKTPWIMRWPGVIAAGRRDACHFVSGVDVMPTLLDCAGVRFPEGMDGFSFLPVLRGGIQEGREWLFTQFHWTSGDLFYPMRCVQSKRHGYIFFCSPAGTPPRRPSSHRWKYAIASEKPPSSRPEDPPCDAIASGRA